MQKSQFTAILVQENALHLTRHRINLLFISSIQSLHDLRNGDYVIIICNSGIEWVSAGIAKETSAVFRKNRISERRFKLA